MGAVTGMGFTVPCACGTDAGARCHYHAEPYARCLRVPFAGLLRAASSSSLPSPTVSPLARGYAGLIRKVISISQKVRIVGRKPMRRLARRCWYGVAELDSARDPSTRLVLLTSPQRDDSRQGAGHPRRIRSAPATHTRIVSSEKQIGNDVCLKTRARFGASCDRRHRSGVQSSRPI